MSNRIVYPWPKTGKNLNIFFFFFNLLYGKLCCCYTVFIFCSASGWLISTARCSRPQWLDRYSFFEMINSHFSLCVLMGRRVCLSYYGHILTILHVCGMGGGSCCFSSLSYWFTGICSLSDCLHFAQLFLACNPHGLASWYTVVSNASNSGLLVLLPASLVDWVTDFPLFIG